jgi:hypothetical protein
MESQKDDVQMRFDDFTTFISNKYPNTLHFFDESSVVRTTGNRNYGSSAKGSRAFELQRYASNANYTINLLHSRFGVDYFNVIDGASNSMELIQIFADVVDVNNDKIANGFQPLFVPGDTIIMDNCAFHLVIPL